MLHLEEGQLAELLDGELDEVTVREINAHLGGCPECARRLEQARGVLQESDLLIARLEVPAGSRPGTITPGTAPARSRLRLYRNLAWAASLVIAAGLGFFASDRRRLRSTPEFAPADQKLAARPTTAPGDSMGPVASPRQNQPTGHAGLRNLDGKTEAQRASPAQPAAPLASGYQTLAEAKRADAPPLKSAESVSPETAAAGASNERDAGVGAPPAAAVPLHDLATLRAAVAPVETVAALSQASAPAEKYRVRAEPLNPGRVEAVKPGHQGLTLGTLSRANPTAPSFHVIPLDDAIRRLSGVIRLIDGLTPDRVESGIGAGVPDADAASDLIRVVYLDLPGREIWLDQQRLPGQPGAPSAQGAGQRPAARAAPDLLPGDTIMVMGRGNGRRVTWTDGSGFWLALSGNLSTDSLVTLARRVR